LIEIAAAPGAERPSDTAGDGRLSPAVESMPAVASLPDDFRQAFFGGLDYAILGRKL